MLTQDDIEFMRETRREVVAGRERLVTLFYEGEPDRDPFTNEPIPGTGGGTRNVNAVVTEVSSLSKAERILVGGIEAVVGDLWFSVGIDLIIDIYAALRYVEHDGKDYELIAQDKKGIGVRNRVEFLARRRV